MEKYMYTQSDMDMQETSLQKLMFLVFVLGFIVGVIVLGIIWVFTNL